MYIRCTLQTQVLSLGPFDLEFMIVSVNNAKCRYCMGLFYRHFPHLLFLIPCFLF